MKKITIKDFLNLDIEKQFKYTSILSHIKQKEVYKIQINELSYNDVKRCFKELSKENANIEMVFTLCLKISKEEFENIMIDNYFRQKKFIENYFINLYQRELNLLNSINEDGELWTIAGGDELNEFSDVLPLSQIAKIYGGYPFDLGEKNYIEIIYLLRMNNIQNKVENEFQKLKSKKK